MPLKVQKKAQVHLYRHLPDGQTVFLILQRTPAKGEIWQSVTGKADPGEDFETCARREVAEETGLPLTGRGVGDVWNFQYRSRERLIEEHVFGFEAASDGVQLSSEHQAFQWVPADTALGLIYFEGIREGLRRVKAALTQEPRA